MTKPSGVVHPPAKLIIRNGDGGGEKQEIQIWTFLALLLTPVTFESEFTVEVKLLVLGEII